MGKKKLRGYYVRPGKKQARDNIYDIVSRNGKRWGSQTTTASKD